MRRTGTSAASSLLSAGSSAISSRLLRPAEAKVKRSSTAAADYATQVVGERAVGKAKKAGARVVVGVSGGGGGGGGRKTSFVSVRLEVEFWNEAWGGKWCEGAKISVKKTKLVVEWQGEEVAVFRIDAALKVEHSEPISKDFNLIFSTAQGGFSVRVAVYSEEDGKSCLEALEAAGAKIVKRGSLPPPTRLSPPTKTRTLPSHSRPSSLLRPISEVEPLRPIESSSQSQQRRASSDFVTAVKMRLDSGRRKVFRRKSTGEADLVVQAASTATASMASRSPSSISMKEGGNGSAWYFQERAATAAKVGGDESSRGLSTAASTKIKKQKKQQSDQSLDSDEISRSSNSSETSESDEYMEEEDLVMEGDKGGLSSDEDLTDGVMRSLADRLRFSRNEDDFELEVASDYEAAKKTTTTNEKLEKFKFLLVNIEEDADMLDTGEFGVTGDYVSCALDDYPDEVLFPGQDYQGQDYQDSHEETRRQQQWIRRSFEELDLESVSTEHDNRRRNSLVATPSSAAYVSRSMENVSSSAAEGGLRSPTSPTRSIRMVAGRLDFGEDGEQGTMV